MLGAVAVRGPSGSAVNASSVAFSPTSCEEFGQGARFAPHDVVDSLWRIFYFWAEGMEISTILFALPSVKKVNDFKNIVKAVVPDIQVQWENAAIFMEPRLGVRVLLMNVGHDGSFVALVKIEHLDADRSLRRPHIHLTTVQMKIAGRYLGIVNCIDHTAFALARVAEMPQTQNECNAAAASLGLDTRSGKSYLSMEKAHVIDEL
ncbi:unnamed protein product, partial [Iphiclides podalirius]